MTLLAAILLELQDEIAKEPINKEAEIIDKFFIIEVDCCMVIRDDNLEVVLFGLYLPSPIKQK